MKTDLKEQEEERTFLVGHLLAPGLHAICFNIGIRNINFEKITELSVVKLVTVKGYKSDIKELESRWNYVVVSMEESIFRKNQSLWIRLRRWWSNEPNWINDKYLDLDCEEIKDGG